MLTADQDGLRIDRPESHASTYMPHKILPPAFSLHRGRDRRRRARHDRDALSQPRRRPAADHPWRAIRRCRRRRRRGVGARRPALADDGRGRDHRILHQCAGAAADRGAARERFHRQDAAGKSARRAGYFLSRQIPRSVASRRFRANRWSAASAPRRPTGATSASSGAAMSPDRAGASIRTTAAWSPTPPCASTDRISCCIPATPSMPTASSPPK